MPGHPSPGVYAKDAEVGAPPIMGAETATAGFVGMAEGGELDRPVPVTSWREFVERFGRHTASRPYLAPAVSGFFANGGQRCYVVRVRDSAGDEDYIGKDGGAGAGTGLKALNGIEGIGIVCIPGVTSRPVQRAMIEHCEGMKYRFCILDPTEGADLNAVRLQRGGVSSGGGYAALYYPWITAAVETSSGGRVGFVQGEVPPSGHLAGVYARVDMRRGIHKAPANEVINGAIGVSCNVTNVQQNVLNPLGVNCIRSLPGRGILVWGARTTSDDPEWRHINVRRLLIHLEESVDRGIGWAVFEQNDERLWARVTRAVENFLTIAWRNGALMGATAEKAFFVRCDRTTMTQGDLDAGRLVALVGVAPVKPAEFVVFRIAQRVGGSE